MGVICALSQVDDETIENVLNQPNPEEELYSILDEEEENSTDLDKAWHAIHFLLTDESELEEDPSKRDDPLHFLINGGRAIPDSEGMRLLTSAEVAKVHQALSHITEEHLKNKFKPEAMEDIYAIGFEPLEEEFDYIIQNFRILKNFVKEAVDHHKGLIITIN